MQSVSPLLVSHMVVAEVDYLLTTRCGITTRQWPKPASEPASAQVRGPVPAATRSDVEVELELVRVGALLDGGDLVLPLPGDPRLDQVRSEHVAFEQEIVIALQRVEHLR